MGFQDSRDEWIEKDDGDMELFVWFTQLLFDKTATTLRSTVLVVSPVHSITILNVSARRRLWLIGNGHILVGYLPVYRSGEHLEGAGSEENGEMFIY